MQQLLDTAHGQADPAVTARFAALIAEPKLDLPDGSAADAELRLSSDPNIVAALDWLDQHADWEPGTARREVAARLVRIDVRTRAALPRAHTRRASLRRPRRTPR